MKTKLGVLIFVLAAVLVVGASLINLKAGQTLRSSNAYREGNNDLIRGEAVFLKREAAKFKTHADILKAEGRMPMDFGDGHRELGQYGWHTESASSVGPEAPIALLRRSTGGAFGAYSFFPAAFQQAKRAWWIHGVMEAGSDILIPINRNASFTSCRNGPTVTITSPSATQYKAGDTLPITSAPCVNTMPSPVGYRVAYISAYLKGEIRDALVVEVPKYSDGSSTNTLRLNKKAPGFAMTYDIGILPPDYVDLCQCTVGGR